LCRAEQAPDRKGAALLQSVSEKSLKFGAKLLAQWLSPAEGGEGMRSDFKKP
jgi:hypothetical protein